jgi:hypothetical protein
MANEKNSDTRLERIMNSLAESVLMSSDEAIHAETGAAGSDPHVEADRTRQVLRQASRALDVVIERVSKLGHTVNSRTWCRGRSGYHNTCVTCGSFVSFTTTGEMRGDALDQLCEQSDRYAIRKREASGN